MLSDYFDLIGGTSTGSIIATALAMGMTVDDIKGLYEGLAEEVFERSWRRNGIITAPYDDEVLASVLKRVFGAETTLGSERILTGLMIMTKRLDSSSPWPLTNVDGHTYSKEDRALFVHTIIRASTAAPYFFGPEVLDVGDSTKASFVDGGVSTANNPSLQLLQIALINGYGLRWRKGEDNLLMISVGTGRVDPRKAPTRRTGRWW